MICNCQYLMKGTKLKLLIFIIEIIFFTFSINFEVDFYLE